MLLRYLLLVLSISTLASVGTAQQKSKDASLDSEQDLVKRMATISKALDLPNIDGIPIVGNEIIQMNSLELSSKQKEYALRKKAVFHDRIALGYCKALTEINAPMDDYYLVDSSESATALAIYHNLLGDAACQPYVKKYGKSIWLGKTTEERMNNRRLFLEKYGDRLKRLAINPPFLFSAYVRVKVDTLNYDNQREAFPIEPLADDGFSGSRKFELRVSMPMSEITLRKGLTEKPVAFSKAIEFDFPRWWNIKPNDREKAIQLIDQACVKNNGTKDKPRSHGQYYIHALVDVKVTPKQVKTAMESSPPGWNQKAFPIGANFHTEGTVTRLRYYLRPLFKVRLSDYDYN